MKAGIGALLALLAMVAAGDSQRVPDTSKILSLSGRMSAAHGCPVAPWLVVSNAHVFDFVPTNTEFPLISYRAESPSWSGEVKGIWTSWAADYALGAPSTDLPGFYPLAKEAPKPGERLWWIGYDWKNTRRAFERKVMSGEVVRDFAGSIVIDEKTFPGSSGSCVLNANGEAVGIIMGTMELDNSDVVTVAVGLWGPWFTFPDEEAFRARAAVR